MQISRTPTNPRVVNSEASDVLIFCFLSKWLNHYHMEQRIGWFPQKGQQLKTESAQK
jgi:hypothetical protein